MNHFDLISDVHLDEISKLDIPKFVRKLLPKELSSTLVFAGDFGYYNEQNYIFLKELKNYYPNILFVFGNNDLKLPLKSNYENFFSVKDRVEDFLLRLQTLLGVEYISDRVVEVEGTKFVGSDIFFDFESLTKRFNVTDDFVFSLWKSKNLDKKHVGWIENPKEYSLARKNNLFSNIKESDVVVTHAPPNFFINENDETLGFFYFDGSSFAPFIENKTWVFGHRHQRSFHNAFGCNFYNASFSGSDSANIISVILTK